MTDPGGGGSGHPVTNPARSPTREETLRPDHIDLEAIARARTPTRPNGETFQSVLVRTPLSALSWMAANPTGTRLPDEFPDAEGEPFVAHEKRPYPQDVSLDHTRAPMVVIQAWKYLGVEWSRTAIRNMQYWKPDRPWSEEDLAKVVTEAEAPTGSGKRPISLEDFLGPDPKRPRHTTVDDLRPVPAHVPLDIIPRDQVPQSENFDHETKEIYCFVERAPADFEHWRREHPGQARPRSMWIKEGLACPLGDWRAPPDNRLDWPRIPFDVAVTALYQDVSWDCYRFEGTLYWRPIPFVLKIDVEAAMEAEREHRLLFPRRPPGSFGERSDRDLSVDDSMSSITPTWDPASLRPFLRPDVDEPDPDTRLDDRADDRLSLAPSSREDVEDLRSGLPRSKRLATAPLPEDERVPVALKGVVLEDFDGRPLGATLIGSYTTEVVRGNSRDPRVLAGDMRVMEVLPRACRLLFPREDQKNRKEGESPFKNRLPTSALELQAGIPSVYVGISAVTIQPVYMLRPDLTGDVELNVGDNFTSFQFRTEPSNQIAGRNTVLHETCVVPGNIAALKKLLINNRHSFEDAPDPLAKLARQNRFAHEYLATEPLANRKVGGEDGHMPNLGKFYKLKDGTDTHYCHEIPPLGILEPPVELVSMLSEFLAGNPRDPMSLNLAIQATVVYFDVVLGPDRKPEEWARGRCQMNHPVPEVSLEVFVLYYPHWLRFHEVHRLTRYIHPFRFISLAYRLDEKVSSSLTIEQGQLAASRVRTLVDGFVSLSEGVPVSRRVCVLPASMPGTTMLWPQRVTKGEPGQKGLFALCLLDDIKTIGLPSYHPPSEQVSLVALPETIARSRFRITPAFQRYVPMEPRRGFWSPWMKSSLVAVSGSSGEVGPVFRPMKGSNQPVPQRSARGTLIPHFQVPQQANFFISEQYLNSMHQNAEARVDQLARLLQAGTPVSGLFWDRSDSAPRWDGMIPEPDGVPSDEMVTVRCSAPDDSELSDDEENPPAGEIAPVALDRSVVTALLKALSLCPELARDWNPVENLLRGERITRADLAQALGTVERHLILELEQFYTKTQGPDEPTDVDKLGMMARFPALIMRVIGTLEPDKEGEADVLKHWEEYRVLMKGHLRHIWEEVEAVRTSINNKLMWRIIASSMRSFFASDLCRDQVRLLTDLRSIAGIPPSESPDDPTV